MKKSIIEYVILAGFHFPSGQGPMIDFGAVNVTVLARAARDFLKDFGVLAPEMRNFLWPAGACGAYPRGRAIS